MPIFDALQNYSNSSFLRLHMPGHKGKTYEHDVTEIIGMDDLQHPSGIIKEAQDKAKKAFHSENTFFLTCGSTIGIHAMLSNVNEKIIIGRDAHKSAINACIVYKLNPIFVSPKKEYITADDYIEVMEKNKDVEYVYITSPNYYGIALDIEKLGKAAERMGKKLLVDEAHGAHFVFSNRFPKSAAYGNAYMWVQSAHKTLPVLTQGAYLHSKEFEPAYKGIWRIHTTSPSYLIMESLDYAREYMENNSDTIEKWIDECMLVQEKLKSINGIEVIECDEKIFFKDKTRIVFNAKKMGYTGYDLSEMLYNKKIMVEMADMINVVCITSPLEIDEIKKIYNAVCNITKKENIINKVVFPKCNYGHNFRDIINKKRILIDYKDAEGKICMEAIGAYPPGIPCAMQGEIITKEMINYFSEILKYGPYVFGFFDDTKIYVME